METAIVHTGVTRQVTPKCDLEDERRSRPGESRAGFSESERGAGPPPPLGDIFAVAGRRRRPAAAVEIARGGGGAMYGAMVVHVNW